MYWISRVFIIWLLLVGQCFGAIYFVDSTTGDNTDNGTTMDLAWNDIEKALESGSLSAGDIVFIRRIHQEWDGGNPTSDILPAYDGNAKEPIYTIGWPRPAIPNTTITQADFTNGSNIVDNVVGVTPDRETHVGRFCTAPNGKEYLITAVLWEAGVDGMGAGDEFTVESEADNVTQTKTGKIWAFTDDGDTTGTIQYYRYSGSAWVEDDNITDDAGGDAEIDAGGETAVGFLIDREYAGSTVTGTNGKFQIEADDGEVPYVADMGAEYGFDDSGWAIQESDWDSDAETLPVIDFADQSYQLQLNDDQYYYFANLDMCDSDDNNGIVYNSASPSFWHSMLFRASTQDLLLRAANCHVVYSRCIVEGVGAGSNQRAIYLDAGASVDTVDFAAYNVGDCCIFSYRNNPMYLENTNLGVEAACGDTTFRIMNATHIIGIDVKASHTNGDVGYSYPSKNSLITIENYQKILGAHKKFTGQGECTTVTAGGGGDYPNARTGGSGTLVEIIHDGSSYKEPIDTAIPPIFTHEYEAEAEAWTCKYYVQYHDDDGGGNTLAATDIWLEAEYIDSYDDTSEYTITTTKSDETISARDNASDWDQYLEIDSITPATDSKIRIKCYVPFYHADDKIYIDPLAVITTS